ncbi:MAG: HDOD domain-containing protein [Ruminococcaceae bacterium]|nr:HDOD domain-containing protein [Oscillospiraceae bacterium]
MKVFIVAIPLFDANMEVQAYRLRDRNGERLLDVANDFRGRSIAMSTTSPALVLLKRLGVEPFAGDKRLFVDVTRLMLMANALNDLNIDPARLIITMPADIQPDAETLAQFEQMRARGYGIALDGLPPDEERSVLMPYVQHLILNYKDRNFAHWLKTAQYRLLDKTVVITHIPDNDTYAKLGANRNALFTGRFYDQPITQGITTISPLKVNALHLLRQVNEDDFDLQDIAKIIERDPSLSISLMRFINSDAVGLKRKVGSIQSAIAILGQQEVRRWATVAISVSLAEDRPSEVTKLSLVRAKFAEGLATAFELGVFQQSLFMAGLFSLLDVILQKPMAEAIKEVAVDQRVHEALVEKSGPLYPVMELIYAYEHAHWDEATILMVHNNVTVDQLNEAFVEALVWYNQLLSSIDGVDTDEIGAAEELPSAE